MPMWRTLLRLSTELHDLGEVQPIDATGADRHAASQHCANRTTYTFKTIKTYAFIDCDTNTILDTHYSMNALASEIVGRVSTLGCSVEIDRMRLRNRRSDRQGESANRKTATTNKVR